MARSILAVAACLSAIASAHPLAGSVLPRDTSIDPTSAISLYYQALESSSLGAVVQADLQLPSIVLEAVNGVSVACTSGSVVVQFNSTAAFDQASSSWPRSDLLLITNHLGNCDAELERGIYHAASVLFDSSTLTITAQVSKTSLQDQAKNVTIAFGRAAQSQNKRGEISDTVDLTWSGDLVKTTGLTVHANSVTVDATVTVDGVVSYNFWDPAASTVDLDISVALDSTSSITTSTTGSWTQNLYAYTWNPLNLFNFTIPGILTVAPVLDVTAGVSLGVNGTTEVTTDTTTSSSAMFHLDLINLADSSSSSVQPQATSSSQMSAAAELQLDPFVGAEIGLEVSLFNGWQKWEADVQAKATVVNGFNVDATVDIAQDGTVTVVPNGSGACNNGYWLNSDFWFNATASLTGFTTADLCHIEVPIGQTACFPF